MIAKAVLVLMLVVVCEVRSANGFEFFSRIYKTISNVFENWMEVIRQPVVERHNRIMKERRNRAHKVKLNPNLTKVTRAPPSTTKRVIDIRDDMAISSKFRKTAQKHKFSIPEATTKVATTTCAPHTRKVMQKIFLTSKEAISPTTDLLTVKTTPKHIRKAMEKPTIVATPEVKNLSQTFNETETKILTLLQNRKSAGQTELAWYFTMAPIKYVTESPGENVTNITYKVVIPVVPKPRWHSFLYWNIIQQPQFYLQKLNASSVNTPKRRVQQA